jgi:hypothetical protein
MNIKLLLILVIIIFVLPKIMDGWIQTNLSRETRREEATTIVRNRWNEKKIFILYQKRISEIPMCWLFLSRVTKVVAIFILTTSWVLLIWWVILKSLPTSSRGNYLSFLHLLSPWYASKERKKKFPYGTKFITIFFSQRRGSQF